MLQIVTWNLGGARTLRPSPHRPNQLGLDAADFLKQVVDPDLPLIAGLQEVGYLIPAYDSMRSPRAGDVCEATAQALGEAYTYGFIEDVNTAYQPHRFLWGRDAYRGMVAAGEGNGFVTNLLFTAWPWPTFAPDVESDDEAFFWTYTQISRASLYSTGNRNTQPRHVLVASLTHPDYGPVIFMTTHLSTITSEDRHDPDQSRTQEGEAIRQNQAREILRVTQEIRTAEQRHEKTARPIILVGDFNAQPDAPTMQDLASTFRLLDADGSWTHRKHEILIDHVLVNDPGEVLPAGKARVITDMPDDLTDHYPVVAVF